MNEDIIEIRYGGSNPFADICNTPLVSYGTTSDGWWKSENNIKLEGQILCCGLSLNEIFNKQKTLRDRFKINLQNLQIVRLDGQGGKNNNGVLINAQYAYVKSISFDESDYKYILPFQIEIESHNADSFAGQYRITEPILKNGYNTLEGGGYETYSEASAKGLEGDGESAFDNARAWVDSVIGSQWSAPRSTLNCDPNSPGVPVFSTNSEGGGVRFSHSSNVVEEVSDEAQGTYRKTVKYIFNPKDEEVDVDDPESSDPDAQKKAYVSYQYGVNLSLSKESLTVSVNGSARSETPGAAEQSLISKDWLSLAQDWASPHLRFTLEDGSICTSVLKPEPIGKNHSGSSDKKSVSFSYTFKTIPCNKVNPDGTPIDPCGEVNVTYNYSESGLSAKSDEASFTLTVTNSARGSCGSKAERRAWALSKLSDVAVDTNSLVGIGSPDAPWVLIGTARDYDMEGASITFEYRAKIKKALPPGSGGDTPNNNDLPCDIQSIDGSITEMLPTQQYNFRRTLCEHWLAIPTNVSLYKKSTSLTVNYKGSSSAGENFAQSLLEGPGDPIKSIVVHNDIDKTIQYDYEWEDNSSVETVG